MKNIILAHIFILSILLALACSSAPEPEIPADLESMRSMLSEKKKTLKSLSDEIEALEQDINEKSGIKPEDSYARVRVDTLIKSEFVKYVQLPATVETDDLVTVSAELGGRILSLNLKEGQWVNKNQLVATLDNEQMRLQIDELNTRLSLATTVYEKQKRLWDQNIGSEIQYLEAKNNKEALEKSILSLENQRSKSQVYAPQSGVVDRRIAKPGEVVAPGQPIITILNNNKVKVSAEVPENYLGKVKTGEYVQIYFPALDKTIKERIDRVGATIDPVNRSFAVEATVSNSSGMLKPNLLAEMRIVESSEKDVISVPVDMVQEEVGGKSYVYIAKTIGKGKLEADKRYLILGATANNRVVVKSGVSAGEFLVTEGYTELKDSQGLYIVSR